MSHKKKILCNLSLSFLHNTSKPNIQDLLSKVPWHYPAMDFVHILCESFSSLACKSRFLLRVKAKNSLRTFIPVFCGSEFPVSSNSCSVSNDTSSVLARVMFTCSNHLASRNSYNTKSKIQITTLSKIGPTFKHQSNKSLQLKSLV